MSSSITTDKAFKQALSPLSLTQQREVGALFVESVLTLCDDDRVKQALIAAKNPNIQVYELAATYKAAKAASIERFTQCGKNAEWLEQAAHFVAAASVTCVTPAEQLAETDNLAWNAAMQSRMARTCEAIANGEGSENQEKEHQYDTLIRYMGKL